MVFKKGKDNFMYGKKGKNCPNYGRKKTIEEKKKMSERCKGDKNPMYGKRGNLSPHYGKKHSEETLKKMSDVKMGINNPIWKYNEVGIKALHAWVKRHFRKPLLCIVCMKAPPYDLANITGIYDRDFKNWRYLCRKCHMESDKRILNLKQFNILKT